MGAGKVCVCVFVIFFNFHMIAGKPFFFSDRFWCDLLCEDDDDNTVSTVPTTTDIWDDMFDICSDCPNTTRRPPTRQNSPVNIMIPPMQQPMNLTMTNVGGSWFMNMVPWGSPGGNNVATTASPAPTTMAPTAAPAPAATTEAPAAATTAAAGATTAAAGATTASPTTAAG